MIEMGWLQTFAVDGTDDSTAGQSRLFPVRLLLLQHFLAPAAVRVLRPCEFHQSSH